MPKNKMGKHLQFYMGCMERGAGMNEAGLCWLARSTIISGELLKLFEPSHYDNELLKMNSLSTAWWGSDCLNGDPARHFTFTSLRQTIVLFMAAINNEL